MPRIRTVRCWASKYAIHAIAKGGASGGFGKHKSWGTLRVIIADARYFKVIPKRKRGKA